MCAPPTFVKSVHVQLSNEGRNVGVLEIRPAGALSIARPDTSPALVRTTELLKIRWKET